jgi:hypothetical protein
LILFDFFGQFKSGDPITSYPERAGNAGTLCYLGDPNSG